MRSLVQLSKQLGSLVTQSFKIHQACKHLVFLSKIVKCCLFQWHAEYDTHLKIFKWKKVLLGFPGLQELFASALLDVTTNHVAPPCANASAVQLGVGGTEGLFYVQQTHVSFWVLYLLNKGRMMGMCGLRGHETLSGQNQKGCGAENRSYTFEVFFD